MTDASTPVEAVQSHPARFADCRLCDQLRDKLIVIDDLHFIDFTHRNGLEVSNHLKWLANEMPTTFNEGLYDEDAAYAQTARRTTPCPVVPFDIRSDARFRAWVNYSNAISNSPTRMQAKCP